MSLSPKLTTLAVGIVAALSAASMAQNPGKPAVSGNDTVVVGGIVDWLEKSDVSALREGVIKQMEFQVGKRVNEGQKIGSLHDDMARLTVAKAKLASQNTGPLAKAEAQRQLSLSQYARLDRLRKKDPRFVSIDEMEKAEAEVKVADAMILDAKENQALAKAELELANQTQKEHQIIAPWTGVIIERMKNPGEAVRANEPVVRMGRTDKLRFSGWIPLDRSYRVKEGDVVEIRPTIEGAELPIEQKKFRGRVSAVGREVTALKNTVQILADVENPENVDSPGLELRKGMHADMTIYLNGTTPPEARNAEAGARNSETKSR